MVVNRTKAMMIKMKVHCPYILIQCKYVQSDTEVSRSTTKYFDSCYFVICVK